MSVYLGDFAAGATVEGFFNTRDTDGAPITLAGTPALRVYKGNSTTEDDSGITLTVDFDSRTGAHYFAIDTSADGTFYSAGANYAVMITAGTVDSVSVVGVVVAHFSIANRPVQGLGTGVVNATAIADNAIDAGAIASNAITAAKIATDAFTAAKFATDAGTEIATAVWGAAARTLTAIDEDNTTVDLDATIRAAVGLAAADLDTQLDAIVADTNELQGDWTNGGRLDLIIDAILTDTAEIGAAGAGLTEAGGTGDHLTALATAAALATVDSNVDAILVDTGTTLDGAISTIDTVVDAIKVQTDKLTFTVANQVDANIQSINDAALGGDGSEGDPWGPAT